MKKILFLLGKYKPNASPNGICSDAVIQELVRQGNDITCVVNCEAKSPNHLQLDGVHVYRIKPRLTYRMFEWCDLHKNHRLNIQMQNLTKILNKAKLFFTIPAWPFSSLIYAMRFYRMAERLHQKENFDAIIAVYAPFESLIAGHWFKKKYPAVLFIPYFLDALSGGWGPKRFSKNTILRHGLWWEKRILDNADKTIVMESSRKHHEKYNVESKFYPSLCYLDIPLIVEREKINVKHIKKQIVYVGTMIFPRRDPRYFIQLMLQCQDIFFNYDTFFVGYKNCETFWTEAKKVFPNNIQLVNEVSHKMATEYQQNADVLLNIGCPNASAIPCKIFEYMSSGKPIIATYPICDEPSLPYLKQYPNALLLDESADLELNAQKLRAFLMRNDFTQINYDDLKQRFYKNTPKAFADMLQKLLHEDEI